MRHQCGRSEFFRRLKLVGIVVSALLGTATDANARTPTPSPGASPTPTPTSNRPYPVAVISVSPNPVRSGERVFLDGTGSSGAIQRFEWRQIGGPPVTIEDGVQPNASFLAPEVEDLSVVTIELFLPSYGGTPSGGGSVEITIVPSVAVLLDVGSITGVPGREVEVEVKLHALGKEVGAIEHDLEFDRWTPVVAADTEQPDCSSAPGATGQFAFTPEGCDPETTCTGVHALVSSDEPLSDAEALYRCRLRLSTEPSEVCEHPLGCANAQSVDVTGESLAVVCRDARAIAELSADATVTFSLIDVTPSEPRVGDEVTLRFSAGGPGGIPQYRLNGATPFFSGGPFEESRNTFGAVEFTLIAECPGTAELQLTVSYETRIGCVGQQFFGYKLGTSEVFPVEVGDAEGFTVNGRVAEFPGACGGAMRGFTVTLEPLGFSTVTELSAGEFSFPNVPPGEYTLNVSPGCNPFGCWPPTAVTVTDQDVFVSVCPLALETPTSTPTATPTPTTPPVCAGDCNRDGSVSIAELIRIINIGLERISLEDCPESDVDGDGSIVIEEMIRAVGNSISRCGSL